MPPQALTCRKLRRQVRANSCSSSMRHSRRRRRPLSRSVGWWKRPGGFSGGPIRAGSGALQDSRVLGCSCMTGRRHVSAGGCSSCLGFSQPESCLARRGACSSLLTVGRPGTKTQKRRPGQGGAVRRQTARAGDLLVACSSCSPQSVPPSTVQSFRESAWPTVLVSHFQVHSLPPVLSVANYLDETALLAGSARSNMR